MCILSYLFTKQTFRFSPVSGRHAHIHLQPVFAVKIWLEGQARRHPSEEPADSTFVFFSFLISVWVTLEVKFDQTCKGAVTAVGESTPQSSKNGKARRTPGGGDGCQAGLSLRRWALWAPLPGRLAPLSRSPGLCRRAGGRLEEVELDHWRLSRSKGKPRDIRHWPPRAPWPLGFIPELPQKPYLHPHPYRITHFVPVILKNAVSSAGMWHRRS